MSSPTARHLRVLRGGEIGMVFQAPATALHPLHRVDAQVSEVLEVHRPALPAREARARARALLERIGVGPDFRHPPRGWPPRPAIDLTEDTSILTAVANDVGMDEVFARQVIAWGQEGDVALGISTSGSSRNVVRALDEARRRGLVTVALVGYDGGRILAEEVAHHVIVAPSENIPRIQEAHATVYHLLRDRVETGAEGAP